MLYQLFHRPVVHTKHHTSKRATFEGAMFRLTVAHEASESSAQGQGSFDDPWCWHHVFVACIGKHMYMEGYLPN